MTTKLSTTAAILATLLSHQASGATWEIVSTKPDGSIFGSGVSWPLDSVGDRMVSDNGEKIVFKTSDSSIAPTYPWVYKTVLKSTSGSIELIATEDACSSNGYVSIDGTRPAITGSGTSAIVVLSNSYLGQTGCGPVIEVSTSGDLVDQTPGGAPPIFLTPLAERIPGGWDGYGSNSRPIPGASNTALTFDTTDTLLTNAPYPAYSSRYMVFASSNGVHWHVSETTDASIPDGNSYAADITDDGNAALFQSHANNLVASDSASSYADLFVRYYGTQTTKMVNTSASGVKSNHNAQFGRSRISSDGRFVFFSSNANNLVSSDANLRGFDVFVKDMATDHVERYTPGVGLPNDAYWQARFQDSSKDGRFVLLWAQCSGSCSTDTGLYIWDRLYNITSAKLAAPGLGENPLYANNARISGDGRFVFYYTKRSDLVANDSNGSFDIYRTRNELHPDYPAF